MDEKRKAFEAPRIIQAAEVRLEQDLLGGSVFMFVQIDGHGVDGFYDFEADADESLNIIWD